MMKHINLLGLAMLCAFLFVGQVQGAHPGNSQSYVARGGGGGDRGGGDRGDVGRYDDRGNGYGGYGDAGVGVYGGYEDPLILTNPDPFPDSQQADNLYNSYKKLPE